MVSRTNVSTVIIGAGHAGLAMSYRLTERSIDHVVLERGEVARKEPESNVEKEWEDIRKLLVNDGATVIPTTASASDKSTAAAEAPLPSADLFVQLFSALDSLDHAKAEFKSVAARKSIRVLQWRKKLPDLKKDLALLKALDEADRKFCEGENVQTGLLEDFKVAIRDKLEKIVPDKDPTPTPEKPYLYITADTSDLRLARALQAAARKRTVAVVMEEDEAHRREDFEQGLLQASGVVFLHGNATRQFVDRWLKEFVKKTRLLKIHPKVVAFCRAPRRKRKKTNRWCRSRSCVSKARRRNSRCRESRRFRGAMR